MALDQRSTVLLISIFVLVCFTHGISAQRSSGWKTLSGKAPLVIARGGLSGLFPDHTVPAYLAAVNNSLYEAVMFCDLQLSKDGAGICRTDLRLDNSTTINFIFPNQSKSYVVNGKSVSGYFSIDYTAETLLNNITAIQPVSSRPLQYDSQYLLLPPEAISQFQPAALWLNVQYSMFFEKHKLSMSSAVISLSKSVVLNYISSTEVGFLQAIAPRFRRTKTKLILMLLGKEDVDPSTNQTYGSLVKNLTFVKRFAAGIMVPKDYIWPVNSNLYLQAPTSLVQDAHSAGLEIYASNFANDEYGMSYNYSYDPIREYLQFVDKDFAVDGILTDFSVTASEAIACYAQNNVSTSAKAGKTSIISHNGASGDYPGCTDIAYQAAISDGADYIDCSVQITKDGVPICRESPDLTIGTNIITNSVFYPARLNNVSDINKMVLDKPSANSAPGIFTFDLTWNEIQGLKPSIVSPFSDGYGLQRNPAAASAGKYMNLTAFLDFAQSQKNLRVIINIQNARAVALARNLSIVEPVISALNKSGYNNMTDRILIQSDDSAVLMKFKQLTKFKLVYAVEETYVDIPDSTIKKIKAFSDAVVIRRDTVFPSSSSYLLGVTDTVERMHNYNMSVFIFLLRNEFAALAFDYIADPTLEIRSYVSLAKVDGLITDFPATASAYMGNACLGRRRGTQYSMYLSDPGAIEGAMSPTSMPPALAPAPMLSSVAGSPLPNVAQASAPQTVSSPPSVPAASPTKPSNACCPRHSLSVSLLIGLFMLFLYNN